MTFVFWESKKIFWKSAQVDRELVVAGLLRCERTEKILEQIFFLFLLQESSALRTAHSTSSFRRKTQLTLGPSESCSSSLATWALSFSRPPKRWNCCCLGKNGVFKFFKVLPKTALFVKNPEKPEKPKKHVFRPKTAPGGLLNNSNSGGIHRIFVKIFCTRALFRVFGVPPPKKSLFWQKLDFGRFSGFGRFSCFLQKVRFLTILAFFVKKCPRANRWSHA